MSRFVQRAAFLLLAGVSALPAQPRAFEVVSIKPHAGPLDRISASSSSGPRLTMIAYTARGLVLEAYNLKSYSLAFDARLPSSDDDYYDILAKAPGDEVPSREQFRQMLQTLLAERFDLQAHREFREMPVYALVVGKGGPKFKESTSGVGSTGRHGVHGRNQTVEASHYPMSALVADLMNYFGVDRPVVDETGLTGSFDFKLEATPEWRINKDSTMDDITIFSAVSDQLGLKLIAQKSKVEMFVVDRLGRPTPN